MKEIPLTKGLFVIVDDEDYERFSCYKWYAEKGGYTFYAERAFYTNGRKGQRFILLLHREILGLKPGDGIKVDHKNRNGLDCRRENLRIATSSFNTYNSKKRIDNTSGYRGVTWNKRANKWQGQIHIEGVYIHLGYFPPNEIIKAALTYDQKAILLYGENAILNFPK